MKDFEKPLPSALLNIEQKDRSNLFAWRGQFSPQLIQYLFQAYCLPGSVVLDPFAGSGTVLCESARMSFAAYGFEINPAAWVFSKVYEFANTDAHERKAATTELRQRVEDEFEIVLFAKDHLPPDLLEGKILAIGTGLSDRAKILCNALVVLLDVHNNKVTNQLVHEKLAELSRLVIDLPFSTQPIKADLQDARTLSLAPSSVDFAITSPPYINVFNYHQNYRRSVELLGWDLLRVARSEIGSNRANRGNRFLTVAQYCLDMSNAIHEMYRVLKRAGRAVLIVGHESRVLGVPFFNADIIERLACDTGLFELVLRQQRVFVNRFGKSIREDVLNLVKAGKPPDSRSIERVARTVAFDAFQSASLKVSDSDQGLLSDAMERISRIEGTMHFASSSYPYYHTREGVFMVKEDEPAKQVSVPPLPTPHLDKLKALLQNRRLPDVDKPRVEEAIARYHDWIGELENVKSTRKDAVRKLVEATNRYKTFVELDLIFDSPEDFLFRQRGQLKLDNTVLEEFLPQLIFRSLDLGRGSFEFGPSNTFAGLSFGSSLAGTGSGGHPRLRTKNQDFVVGKRLYLMTSFHKDFHESQTVEAHLGFVCAECKTNLDKTMFQEAVATSRDLKIAVPSSLYFLICEFLDMTPVSITPTQIDDVLIVRKSKRMSSNIRQEYRSAGARREHRQAYAEFLDSAKFYPDVFQRMVDRIDSLHQDAAPETEHVLKQGHF
ncbi:MAG: Bpu10I family restriction endonuclease [Pirellulaceae bacterium]|nr:Bpu10I family restriction endonuclease [Pirellulaceae bacterium]